MVDLFISPNYVWHLFGTKTLREHSSFIARQTKPPTKIRQKKRSLPKRTVGSKNFGQNTPDIGCRWFYIRDVSTNPKVPKFSKPLCLRGISVHPTRVENASGSHQKKQMILGLALWVGNASQ